MKFLMFSKQQQRFIYMPSFLGISEPSIFAILQLAVWCTAPQIIYHFHVYYKIIMDRNKAKNQPLLKWICINYSYALLQQQQQQQYWYQSTKEKILSDVMSRPLVINNPQFVQFHCANI